MGQWYSARLESALPSGFPGSIPGVGVFILTFKDTDVKEKGFKSFTQEI